MLTSSLRRRPLLSGRHSILCTISFRRRHYWVYSPGRARAQRARQIALEIHNDSPFGSGSAAVEWMLGWQEQCNFYADPLLLRVKVQSVSGPTLGGRCSHGDRDSPNATAKGSPVRERVGGRWMIFGWQDKCNFCAGPLLLRSQDEDRLSAAGLQNELRPKLHWNAGSGAQIDLVLMPSRLRLSVRRC
jgi:hypothetical protein